MTTQALTSSHNWPTASQQITPSAMKYYDQIIQEPFDCDLTLEPNPMTIDTDPALLIFSPDGFMENVGQEVTQSTEAEWPTNSSQNDHETFQLQPNFSSASLPFGSSIWDDFLPSDEF